MTDRARPTDDNDIGYRRTSLDYGDIVRRRRRRLEVRWPKEIAAVRSVLPEGLQKAWPPAVARRGSWLVTAVDGTGRAVGYAWATPMACSNDEVTIEEIAVLRSHQRRGIGSQLIRRAATWMVELGYEQMSLYPIGSKNYLVQLGFRPVPELPTTLIASTRAITEVPQPRSNRQH